MTETTINPWGDDTPQFPKLMGELAFLTAAKKQVTNQLNAVRAAAERELRAMKSMGFDRAELRIGESKVGSATITKPTVKVTNDDLFGEIAGEIECNGAAGAYRHVTFELPDCTAEQEEEITEAIEAILGYAIDSQHTWKPTKAFMESLKVVQGHVVAPDGSVMPGAVVTEGTMRVTGCKPEDVAEAINLSNLQAPSVAQMLEAGND